MTVVAGCVEIGIGFKVVARQKRTSRIPTVFSCFFDERDSLQRTMESRWIAIGYTNKDSDQDNREERRRDFESRASRSAAEMAKWGDAIDDPIKSRGAS